MNFSEELHLCPVCQDYVPFVAAVRGASCAECGRPFSPADERAYLRFRRWSSGELVAAESGALVTDIPALPGSVPAT